jgi:hypothetical protein
MYNNHQSNELFLRRLCGDSGVQLQACELGPALPITTDFAACARFFKPWLMGCHIRYAGGRYSLEVPLSRVVAEGQSKAVLEALARAPRWLVKTLLWPHSVLGFLAANDEKGAIAHLTEASRWAPMVSEDWEAAGIYWAVLLKDRPMAAQCFERAIPDYSTDIYYGQISLAHAWLRSCGDTDSAMRRLYADPDTGQERVDLAWPPLIARADAWMSLFGRRDLAADYLKSASEAGSIGTCRGLFLAAMAWMGLLGDRQKAAALADQGLRNKDESLFYAALYWLCFADDPEKARQCLWSKEWSYYPSALFRITLARYMVMFRGFSTHQECLRHAEALIKEVAREDNITIFNRCKAAKLWSHLSGAGAEELLAAAANEAGESCDFLTVADAWRRMTHLSDNERLAKCTEALRRAESIAANAIDYSFCARSWKTLVGDEVNAKRCIIKGEECDGHEDADEIVMLAQNWTQLLGRPDEARRLAGRKSA